MLRTTFLLLFGVLVLGIAAPAQAVLTQFEDATIAVSTDDLLQTSLESVAVSSDAGFQGEGSFGEPALRDGTAVYGNTPVVEPHYFTHRDLYVAGIQSNNWVEYSLDTTVNTLGYDLTQIDVFNGWGDDGRDTANFSVSFSTVDAPTTFTTLTSVNYTHPSHYGRIGITPEEADGATGVKVVRFDFPGQENNGVGYSQIDVIGAPVPEPSTIMLLGMGLAGFVLCALRRRK